MARLRVTKSPSEALALTNCAFIHPSSLAPAAEYVVLNGRYRFNLKTDPSVEPGHVGLSKVQRSWAQLALNDDVAAEAFQAREQGNVCAGTVNFRVDLMKRGEQQVTLDAEKLAALFHAQFDLHVFTLGQTLVVNFGGHNLLITVHALATIDAGAEAGAGADWALLMAATAVKVFAGGDSPIRMAGSGKATFNPNAILDPTFNFSELGIGGLDEELLVIFRRAFTSRLFPPEFTRSLGIQPVRGILLHGPPGTGKTLIARQIGKVLNSHEPKIVNGPEILNKFVGQSEENIRNLFKDAEAEFKSKGDASQLHVIIFDEIDAICRQRGSRGDSTGVGDSVVTQLLSKLDGVDQLDNILVIGMTNRFDLIDEALLRPGRLELHLEISLADEPGRLDILRIHTALLQQAGRLAADLDLAEIAAVTKNYSGAELAGLVKAAASVALTRHIKVGTVAAVKDDYDQVRVGHADFAVALEDIRPAFGSVDDELAGCGTEQILHFSNDTQRILDEGASYAKAASLDTRNNLVSVLVHGEAGAGKTALAARIAQQSGFPFIKILSLQTLMGMSEQACIYRLTQVFADACKSELSCVILDNLEDLADWNPVGPRYSPALVKALKSVLGKRPPAKRRLLVLATTSNREALNAVGLGAYFKHEILVPAISTLPALQAVLEACLGGPESAEILGSVRAAMGHDSRVFSIPVKNLLALIGHAACDEENVAQCFLGEFERYLY